MRLVIIWIILTSQMSYAETLTTFTFSTLSRGSAQQDKMSELVIRKAYASLGIDVEIITLPGQRALQLANNGKYDGELRRSIVDPELYPNLIKVPVPVRILTICAYGLNSDIQVISLEDLKQYNIGVQRGGSTSVQLAKNAKNVELVSRIDQLIAMLRYERIDMAIGNCDIVKRHLSAMNISDIYVYQPVLIKKELYHYIHKRHKPLLKQISQAIAEVHQKNQPEGINILK